MYSGDYNPFSTIAGLTLFVLIYKLQARQRDEFIIDKLKDVVKAGNHEDAACGVSYAAQDEAFCGNP